MENQANNQGLPVKGYQPQSDEAVELVNANKVTEEQLLRRMDEIAAMYKVAPDGRWFSIARTHFEQGFMALNRAIFKPGRVELDEDVASQASPAGNPPLATPYQEGSEAATGSGTDDEEAQA